MDCPLGPKLIFGYNLWKIEKYLVVIILLVNSQMDHTGGDTSIFYHLVWPLHPSHYVYCTEEYSQGCKISGSSQLQRQEVMGY